VGEAEIGYSEPGTPKMGHHGGNIAAGHLFHFGLLHLEESGGLASHGEMNQGSRGWGNGCGDGRWDAGP
jgi:hypothetical protein